MRHCFWLVFAAAALAGQEADERSLSGSRSQTQACDAARSERLASQARAAATEPVAAAALLGLARQACPELVEFLLERARLLAEHGEHELAIQAADEYLEEAPRSVPGLEVKANSELMAQRFESALETADETLRRAPRSSSALKVRGNALYFLGEAAGAESAFLQLLDMHPADTAAAYMLGRIYYQENRFELAAAQFQKVIRLEPRSFKAYDNLALCYEALGDAENAVRHYLAAIDLARSEQPDYDWPYANLANLLIDGNDPQRGFDAAATAAKLNPGSARNFFLAGKALTRLGRHREALQWLEQSAALDADYAEPLYLLGQAYKRLGDDESARRALAAFESVKARQPDEIR